MSKTENDKVVKKLVLPTTATPPSQQNPSTLIIFSKPKAGKTILAAGLEDNLIIDLENGTKFYNALKVNANNWKELSEVIEALKAEKKASGKNPYKYLTVDTITKLEEIVIPYAVTLYRGTVMGKNYGKKDDGTFISPYALDIRTLPNGAGYQYLRTAFLKVVTTLADLCDGLILLGHLATTSIEKDGKELLVMELALGGKLKSLVSGSVDSIAYLYRRGNETVLNFDHSVDVLGGSRSKHLTGKEIVVAEQLNGGEMVYHWDRVFI